MSGSELQRIEVLSEVLARKRTEVSAAAVLGLSTRQTRRLVRAYRDGGGGALINKAGGRASNNQLIVGVREYVVELVRTRYADFGPTLAAEVLLEKDGVKVSRETLRKWMIEDGLWLSRRQRRSFHQPRLRRESYGELVQIDGSDHRWFEQRGPACSLLVFIDDATGRLMQSASCRPRARHRTSSACAVISMSMAARWRSTRISTLYSESTAKPRVVLA